VNLGPCGLAVWPTPEELAELDIPLRWEARNRHGDPLVVGPPVPDCHFALANAVSVSDRRWHEHEQAMREDEAMREAMHDRAMLNVAALAPATEPGLKPALLAVKARRR